MVFEQIVGSLDPNTMSFVMGLITNIVYDGIKKTRSFTKEYFIEALSQKLPNNSPELITNIADEISTLNLDRTMSEFSIEEQLKSSQKLNELINKLQVNTQNITQNNVYGDNIAGNKIINNNPL